MITRRGAHKRANRHGWNWLKTHPELEAHKEIARKSADRFARADPESERVTRGVQRSLKRAARGR